MRRIAHISDLHFGAASPEAAQALARDIRLAAPHLVVVSGDLTMRARPGQFRAARDFLDSLELPWLAVPGNHDLPLYNAFQRFLGPLSAYRRHFGKVPPVFFQDNEISVLGLSTARSLAWKGGRVNLAQAAMVRSTFCDLPDEQVSILVTHHPFLPPPSRARGAVGRASRALKMLDDCNLDLILSGHFHQSYHGNTHAAYSGLAGSTLVIQAGTALSNRTRQERNAYNLLHVSPHRIFMEVRLLGKEGFTPGLCQEFVRGKELWMPSPPLNPNPFH